MENVRVLLVEDTGGTTERLRRVIGNEGFRVTQSPAGWGGESLGPDDDFQILIIYSPPGDSRIGQLIRTVRERLPAGPIQIVGITADDSEYGRVIDAGADDVVSIAASDVELAARLRAAAHRLTGQSMMVREREYYRRAVHDEEKVNARILERNRMLTDACKSLESMKRVLEESNSKLQEIVQFDMLSGLLSRVALFSTMDSEIERAVRLHSPLSGFMTDIDNFKNINDNWGHPSGDQVIRDVGSRLTRSLRKYDHAGRYGGEEFFVVLPNAAIDRAGMIAERFRHALTGSPVRLGSENVTVTASIGVAEFKASEPRDSWVKRADQAMYLAKQQGRDRVCVLN